MTILVGYAPRAESRAALNKAIDIARTTGERIVVVNAGPGGEHRSSNLLNEAQQRDLQQVLDGCGVDAEFRQYARGRSTAAEMKEVAAELEPSIVVIGLRRRGAVGRFMMGSVSDELLRELDQPVLCVKQYADHTPDAVSSKADTVPVSGSRRARAVEQHPVEREDAAGHQDAVGQDTAEPPHTLGQDTAEPPHALEPEPVAEPEPVGEELPRPEDR
ncbi:universal stress protein [Micrococcus lylae]|uniref:Universal stress protein n=1 Tax=Micrococcus lylae TaxID=1273 RepID=A0ABY2JZ74_9MICC|nr:universal stress protein [Micrococcus lylae]TFH99097.1 universal stress protein [Micrococcus lylae]